MAISSRQLYMGFSRMVTNKLTIFLETLAPHRFVWGQSRAFKCPETCGFLVLRTECTEINNHFGDVLHKQVEAQNPEECMHENRKNDCKSLTYCWSGLPNNNPVLVTLKGKKAPKLWQRPHHRISGMLQSKRNLPLQALLDHLHGKTHSCISVSKQSNIRVLSQIVVLEVMTLICLWRPLLPSL